MIALSDVYYVPELHGNLIAVSKFTSDGGVVHFIKDSCELSKGDITAITCK